MSGTGTPRLYFEDPLLTVFSARVTAHSSHAGRPSLLLDRTAFYPEAGGQMSDRGLLAGAPIADVQVDDADLVHHVLVEGATLPEIGMEVSGAIDRARRRVHMALHTGQHMLSRALLDEAGGETVSSRLGESSCTIDLGLASVDEAKVAAAEALVNRVIDDDVRIRAFFPDAAELAALPLRRRPKVDENVRVIQIGDYDVSPCGGTHCTGSAQVGLVRITGIERYKGMTRVTFAAGRRARDELGAEAQAMRALGRSMSCGALDVPEVVEKLRGELSEARTALGQARTKLAEAAAVELVAAARARGDGRVAAAWDGVDVDFLRAVAKRVTAEPNVVAFLAAREGDAQKVLVTRSGGASFDCGAFLKAACAAAGGRGGGGKDRAEGRVPGDADWLALVAEHAAAASS
jgi:alanyl-tRNA synthetase